MKAAILFIASGALLPLALLAPVIAPSSPLWLTAMTIAIALVLNATLLVAHWVRAVARVIQIVILVLGAALVSVVLAAMVTAAAEPEILWPLLVVGLILLVDASIEPVASPLDQRAARG